MERNKPIVVYLPTISAYDRWAQVYDTDSNPLQALDDSELKSLLPEFFSLLASATTNEHLKLLDLGSGTGRNTIKLLHIPNAKIVGLDASEKMLEIARTRCDNHLRLLSADSRAESVVLETFDMLSDTGPPTSGNNAHAIISTLVLEHIPLTTFFSTVSMLLRPADYLLVTNMHPEMGGKSQAGFLDPKSGQKVRPVSYAHRIEDVVQEARRWGLEVDGKVQERSIDESLAEMLGTRARKWVGVYCWFGMIFQRRT
ncbi:hypothetical protein MMC20_002427 [Loxospora ochrophaea]|nr:hypothetical protein [Loxospora ochrophaea]